MKSLELFSGCGGLAKGLEMAGFRHQGFVEFNKWACASLRENFNPALVHETDIRSFDFKSVGPVDLIAGGPPCQPFSLGGLAKANNDARDMFPQAIRAIHELRPKAFVFENVKGLLRKSFADYFEYIVLRLTYPDYGNDSSLDWREHLKCLREQSYPFYQGLKYDVQFKLVNAVDYGVPQNRERVFIVGFRSDIGVTWKWPEETTTPTTVAQALRGLPDPRTGNAPVDHVFIPGAKSYAGHTGSDFDKPSKTIKAGAHGVPGGENMIRFPNGEVRYMTVHEAKLIQSFPPSYKICGSWGEALRQIGNAVPVKLAEAMGRQVFKALKSAVYDSDDEKHFRTDNNGNLMIFEGSENNPRIKAKISKAAKQPFGYAPRIAKRKTGSKTKSTSREKVPRCPARKRNPLP